MKILFITIKILFYKITRIFKDKYTAPNILDYKIICLLLYYFKTKMVVCKECKY